MCINRLFAYCKGGKFIILIRAWFGFSSAKEGKSGFICNLVNSLKAFWAAQISVHFMKILTVYTLNSHLLTLKAHDHKMYVFCRPLKYLMHHRQTVWTQIRLLLYEQSDLGPQCLPLCLCLKDIFRCSYFVGVLRTK